MYCSALTWLIHYQTNAKTYFVHRFLISWASLCWCRVSGSWSMGTLSAVFNIEWNAYFGHVRGHLDSILIKPANDLLLYRMQTNFRGFMQIATFLVCLRHNWNAIELEVHHCSGGSKESEWIMHTNGSALGPWIACSQVPKLLVRCQRIQKHSADPIKFIL